MGRKPKEWQREPGWWSENFFAVRDSISATYFKVEEPDRAPTASLCERSDRLELPCRNGRLM
jgi:hypothetical protein